MACDLQDRHAAGLWSDAVGRHDLTDEAWALVEALLPVAGWGRPARNLRRRVDGIRHRVRAECPWRDVPERFLEPGPGRAADPGRRGGRSMTPSRLVLLRGSS
ncbi:transposase [Streptomyces sp. NBC_01800]|uniref:transposase n=1 Tax=Streptomyces sp. NBC_01800 TaxID=2975945 RepID=UPI003FA3B393